RLDDPLVKLNYQVDARGFVSSPQAPTEPLRHFAESGYSSGYAIASATQRLMTLNGLLSHSARLASGRVTDLSASGNEPAAEFDRQVAEKAVDLAGEAEVARSRKPAAPQVEQSANEYGARLQATQTAQNRQEAVLRDDAKLRLTPVTQSTEKNPTPPEKQDAEDTKDGLKKEFSLTPAESAAGSASSSDHASGDVSALAGRAAEPTVGGPEAGVSQSAFAAKWLDRGVDHEPELVFEREVEADGVKLKQGFWLDWPALRASLLATSKDLFPSANLVPMVGGIDNAPPEVLGLALAAIPAKFEAGPYPVAAAPSWTPTRTALVVTWLAAVGATIAIGLVLRESNELAERRGRFVTAVTHELRTPLTTFVMYSQMLAGGMVKDEETKTSYVRTLLRESQRLAGIVESVLEYARLGRRRGNSPRSTTTAAKLVEMMTPSLSSRCHQSGMELVVETHGELGFEVVTDPPTLERIVFNLVDNACKYAADSSDKRVHLFARCEGRDLELWVRDHGPGVASSERQSLFRPFVRGKAHADGTVPGLGLGLALAQSLATELGGTLRLSDRAATPGAGAEFVLRLPGGAPAG
ncbi:MAG: HAMP domain-containing sensor histidine kinase, partial [Phycisphaerales bacterium]